jgi:predicted transcriptional regulator
MVEELVGYVNGGVRRRQVVEALSKGTESLEALTRLTRISRLALQKTIDEMTAKNIVAGTKDGYKLTPDGEHVVFLLKSMQ